MINKKEWKSIFEHSNYDLIYKFYVILQDAQMPAILLEEESNYKLYVPNDFVAEAKNILEQYSGIDEYE
ncbi:MAG: hypothetical protein NZ519_08220 [Bacteroidia bacterium]|nr:hypothetical protein [Bacteroidia bacterium]MDW8302750.1 hypothetical protein [Bacteroidia bacterium]